MAPRRNGISFEPKQLQKGLKVTPALVEQAIGATTRYYATRGENYMKANAPWTDRTSNARNGLAGKATRSPNLFKITYFHQVPYGIWLEVRFSGRNAIIMPTVREMGPQVMHTLSDILAKLGKP